LHERKAGGADLFSREEVLAGLPARRASLLLFLIESRTAHLVALSRRAMERFLTEEAAQERDLALLEAFSRGQEIPARRRPTIQNLERFAAKWADLVPDNPRIQAALAHALARRAACTGSRSTSSGAGSASAGRRRSPRKG